MGRVVGLTFEETVASAVTMPDPEGTENKAAKPKGTAKKG